MLFEELGKLKRTSIMNSIVMVALGIVLIICPATYTDGLITLLGYGLIIMCATMTLNFITSKKVLADFIYFTGALVLGIAGFAVLVFSDNIVRVLATIFGIYLILSGAGGIISALTYARRAQRKGWELLVALAGLLLLFGLIVMFNPWWDTPRVLMQVMGWALLFSSVTSIVRLVITWPIKSE